MREGSVIDGQIAQDFPALGVLYATRAVGGRRFQRAGRERLRLLGDRVGGERVATLRQQAIPGAYRAFARQVGLDPDADDLPLERVLMDRIRAGRFVPDGPVTDPCTVAMLETGVPVWALDDEQVHGALRVGSVPDEAADPGDGGPRPGGLAVWDAARPLAPLLGPPPPGLAATASANAVRLYALRVEGVPDATVREALWTAGQLMGPDA